MSREVGWVDFVDQSSKCCLVIKQNLIKTGFIDKAHVYCCPVMKAISFLERSYDMVFVDPPYADNSLSTLIPVLARSTFISRDSVILVSHASRNILDQQYGSLSKIKEKRYGDTCISIYQKGGCILTTAIYPGSFDPITNGHLDIIKRASSIFEKVILGIYDIPQKSLLFSVKERVDLARQAVTDYKNVEVIVILRDYSGVCPES